MAEEDSSSHKKGMRIENFMSSGNIITIFVMIVGFGVQWGTTTEKLEALRQQVIGRPSSDSFKALEARVEKLERADSERSKTLDDVRSEIAKVSAGQQIQTVLLQGLSAQITDIKESSKARLKP